MRAVSLAVLAVFVLTAAAGAWGLTHKQWTETRGPLTITRGTIKRDQRGYQPASIRDTDAPVKQPHGMMVAVQSYCVNPWNKTDAKTFSGGFKVTPPQIIYGAYSGKFVEGFEGEADPGSDLINATASYASTDFVTSAAYRLDMFFAAVSGEWEYELVSPTILNATLANADIGRKAVYTIIVGDPHARKPTC